MREPAGLRKRLARLLDAFRDLAVPNPALHASSTSRMRTLLEQFLELRNQADASERGHAARDRQCISDLLIGYTEAVDRHGRRQEHSADDFNLLDVMHLTGKEIRHSMVLAWLLDHDMRKLGTHAQGNLGFRLFLNEFGLPIDYADCKYWVRREVAGDESIVDVEVACRGRFLIHIENKIWACEGPDQTLREWSDLQRRASGLQVSTPNVHALFLTPHGAKPTNPNFHAISWGRIVRVLGKFADQAKPPDVKLFAAHYARALRRFIVVRDTSEDDHVEGTLERS
jgi:hypothetical protein